MVIIGPRSEGPLVRKYVDGRESLKLKALGFGFHPYSRGIKNKVEKSNIFCIFCNI